MQDYEKPVATAEERASAAVFASLDDRHSLRAIKDRVEAALHAHARDVRAKALEEAIRIAKEAEEEGAGVYTVTARIHGLLDALIPTESEVGNPAALPSGLRVKRTGASLYITAATEADFIPVQVTDAEAVAFAHEVLRVVTATGEGGE